MKQKITDQVIAMDNSILSRIMISIWYSYGDKVD